MMFLKRFLGVLGFIAGLQSGPSRAELPIQTDLIGPKSQYSALLLESLKSWPPVHLKGPPSEGRPIEVACLETPGNALAIGIEQSMLIEAPLASVVQVLDDFEHYPELFVGINEVRVIEKEDNRILTAWEQHLPFPFPNVRYQMTYLVSRAQPDRVIYRYQLHSGKSLKYSDGLIVVDSVAPGKTRYIEYDFMDGEWGLLKIISPSTIWKESLREIFVSDLAIKFKAEHPESSYSEIIKKAENGWKNFPVKDVLNHRGRFYLLK